MASYSAGSRNDESELSEDVDNLKKISTDDETIEIKSSEDQQREVIKQSEVQIEEEINFSEEIKQDINESKGQEEINEFEGLVKGDVDQSEGQEEMTESEDQSKEEINVFGYIDRGDFTTEIFKIEISNLPNRFGVGQLKKKLIFLGLKPCKIKAMEHSRYAFVTFRCEEDREQAMKVIEGHVWKNKPLKCRKAAANADPLQLKRKMEAEETVREESCSKVARVEADADTDTPQSEKLNNAVIPLWKTEYEEQLKSIFAFNQQSWPRLLIKCKNAKKCAQIKDKSVMSVLRKLSKEMEKSLSDEDKQWLKTQRKENSGLICTRNSVRPSPVVNGYRNKCEFTIGISPSGVDKTIGFRFSGYKQGVLSVLEPAECINIPDSVKNICRELQQYLQTGSTLSSFSPADRSGYWQTAVVRLSHSGLMLSVVLHPQQLTKDEIEVEKSGLFNHFKHLLTSSSSSTSDDARPVMLTSLYLQLESDRKEINGDAEYIHLGGEEYIEERLLDMNFRISPAAFFQVNTAAAEVLYRCIGDWCSVTDKTTVVDVCCGTGTIGLTLAKRVKRVIGIELCKEAVTDAKANAAINGITNAEFRCGKAEDVLPALMYSLGSSEDVVVVVDPPRAGLHADVIRAIRRSSFIQRLVYVSCKPTAAVQNIVDLTRQTSRRVLGRPFRLLEVTPVDLFPHTEHYELVLRLARQS